MNTKLKFLSNKEKDYRGHSGINQSALSLLDKDPLECKKRYIDGEQEEYKDYFMLGSLVDDFITDESKVYKDFYVTNFRKPAEKLGDFCEELLRMKNSRMLTLEETFSNDIILEARKNSNYMMSLKEKTFTDYFKPGGKYENSVVGYIKALEEAKGLPIVSTETIKKAETKADILKTHPFSTDVFNSDGGYDIHYQVPIYFTVNIDDTDYSCKGLIDVLHIDEENKNIRMYDIKTTSGTISEFKNSYIKYKYYLQASFYYFGLLSLLPDDYTIEIFEFVVIDVKNKVQKVAPSYSDLKAGKSGGYDIFGNRIKGYEDLIRDLEYHKNNDCWDYPAEIYKSNGTEFYDIYNTL